MHAYESLIDISLLPSNLLRGGPRQAVSKYFHESVLVSNEMLDLKKTADERVAYLTKHLRFDSTTCGILSSPFHVPLPLKKYKKSHFIKIDNLATLELQIVSLYLSVVPLASKSAQDYLHLIRNMRNIEIKPRARTTCI